VPYTYNLESYELSEPVPTAALEQVNEDVQLRGEVVGPAARAGFVIDYNSNAAVHALARLRRDSIVFRRYDQPFTSDGRHFTAGSIAVLKADNPNRDLDALARSLADESGVAVVGVDRPPTATAALVRPNPGRIAVVMDRPVSPAPYGHIWYTFEQLYGVEFTALSFERLPTVNLDKYSVLILPDGNYGSVNKAIAGEIAAKLRPWVEKGGTLIGLRGASAWIAAEENNLTAARVRRLGPGQPPRVPSVPGAIFRATITDPLHPLVQGYNQTELPVMVWSGLSFEAPASVEVPVRIAEASRAKLSGFAFLESLRNLAGTPYLLRDKRGQGSVVLFLDDPNFRLFWDGLTMLFFNAVFLTERSTS
jgi:hypothetical protein